MASSFTSRSGLALDKSPNARRQAARRRWAVVFAILGLAIASGVVGALTGPRGEGPARATGPFSYFPHS
jgi:hypothetical protein